MKNFVKELLLKVNKKNEHWTASPKSEFLGKGTLLFRVINVQLNSWSKSVAPFCKLMTHFSSPFLCTLASVNIVTFLTKGELVAASGVSVRRAFARVNAKLWPRDCVDVKPYTLARWRLQQLHLYGVTARHTFLRQIVLVHSFRLSQQCEDFPSNWGNYLPHPMTASILPRAFVLVGSCATIWLQGTAYTFFVYVYTRPRQRLAHEKPQPSRNR